MNIKGSPIAWIALGLLCLSVSIMAVRAQVKDEPPAYEPPSDRQAETGHCTEYEVKMRYAATDPEDPLQANYVVSAEQYQRLASLGQEC